MATAETAYIWNPGIEQLPREQLAALQLERLRASVARAYAHVPFHRQRLDELGVTPDDIRSLDDLRRLPFTRKQDLRDHYPFGFLPCRARIVRVQACSGTSGKLSVVATRATTSRSGRRFARGRWR